MCILLEGLLTVGTYSCCNEWRTHASTLSLSFPYIFAENHRKSYFCYSCFCSHSLKTTTFDNIRPYSMKQTSRLNDFNVGYKPRAGETVMMMITVVFDDSLLAY